MHPTVDYLDGDVAYLLGLIVARGTLSEAGGLRQLVIQFPYKSLSVEGIESSFDQESAIRLGLEDIRERILELLDTDISVVRKKDSVELVIRIIRNSMAWRNINLILGGQTSYQWFAVPAVLFDSEVSTDIKREFIRGYADVAGNVRHSNRYVDGRHRVRLDILNFPANWQVPVQLCTLLQEHLSVPVQLITWGHPNLGRDFREHQLNIFAKSFVPIGFFFKHKQKILEEMAAQDKDYRPEKNAPCPGIRRLGPRKPSSPDESSDKLDPRLVGKHFDGYWQICKALGCTRLPLQGHQLDLLEVDSTQ